MFLPLTLLLPRHPYLTTQHISIIKLGLIYGPKFRILNCQGEIEWSGRDSTIC